MKMLQMGIDRQMCEVYLGERDYKYLTALGLMYLRLTVPAPQVYTLLEPFYIDNRKLRVRNSLGMYQLGYMDKFVEELLGE